MSQSRDRWAQVVKDSEQVRKDAESIAREAVILRNVAILVLVLQIAFFAFRVITKH